MLQTVRSAKKRQEVQLSGNRPNLPGRAATSKKSPKARGFFLPDTPIHSTFAAPRLFPHRLLGVGLGYTQRTDQRGAGGEYARQYQRGVRTAVAEQVKH
ncbi:hypothetical protein NVIRENTERO_03621 [Sodalis praecaptivus]|nr:hypothetical protein NVIRENTERO_03621 [Sodalis praecaptivus]